LKGNDNLTRTHFARATCHRRFDFPAALPSLRNNFAAKKLRKIWSDEMASAGPQCGRSARLKGTSQMRERSRLGIAGANAK
jgi:hypothetical protein